MLANRDIWQHAVIDELPKYLKKELVRHLYAKQHANRVPVFAFIASLDASQCADAQDVLDEVFLACEYVTYAPGQTLVDFADKPDRLIILESGKVEVQMQHPLLDLNSMTLSEGDYLGDMIIMGETDWATSTHLHLDPAPDDKPVEPTEIRVTTEKHFVVVLQLHAERFQRIVAKSSSPMQGELQTYLNRWTTSRQRFARSTSVTRAGRPLRMKMVQAWEGMSMRVIVARRTRDATSNAAVPSLRKKGRVMDWATNYAGLDAENQAEAEGRMSPLAVLPSCGPAADSGARGEEADGGKHRGQAAQHQEDMQSYTEELRELRCMLAQALARMDKVHEAVDDQSSYLARSIEPRLDYMERLSGTTRSKTRAPSSQADLALVSPSASGVDSTTQLHDVAGQAPARPLSSQLFNSSSVVGRKGSASPQDLRATYPQMRNADAERFQRKKLNSSRCVCVCVCVCVCCV